MAAAGGEVADVSRGRREGKPARMRMAEWNARSMRSRPTRGRSVQKESKLKRIWCLSEAARKKGKHSTPLCCDGQDISIGMNEYISDHDDADAVGAAKLPRRLNWAMPQTRWNRPRKDA